MTAYTFTNLEHLSLGSVYTSGGITSRGFVWVENFEHIRNFTNLKSLSLSIDQNTDLSPVGDLGKLEELHIIGELNLKPLARIATLRTLHVLPELFRDDESSNYPSYADTIGSLSQLRKLTYLAFGKPREFSPLLLANWNCLEELEFAVGDPLKPEEIATLAKLPKLQKLTLYGTHNEGLHELLEKPGLTIKLLQ